MTFSDGGIAPIAIAGVLASIVYYVWVALAVSRVFVKLGEPGWKAWVPFLNTVTLYELGGFTGLWLISLFFPVVNIAGFVVFYVALHGVNRQFGKGVGYTVLAILALPIWASVLGFGRATPLGGLPPAAVAALAESPFEARMAALALAPEPPIASAVSEDHHEHDHTPKVDPVVVAPDPWAPPGLAEQLPAPAVATDAPAVSTAPPGITAPPASTSSSTEQPPPTPEFDDDHTVIRRRGPVYSLQPEVGPAIVLTAPVVLVGRNPASTEADAGAQLVAIADPSKTMSKTHARLVLADGLWTLTDLQSTNGTLVIDPAGAEVELEPGASASVSGAFTLGQFPLTLVREG